MSQMKLKPQRGKKLGGLFLPHLVSMRSQWNRSSRLSSSCTRAITGAVTNQSGPVILEAVLADLHLARGM